MSEKRSSKDFVLAMLCGAGLFCFAQTFFLPPMPSCVEAFTRKTVDEPTWANDYWGDVVKRYKKEKQRSEVNE